MDGCTRHRGEQKEGIGTISMMKPSSVGVTSTQQQKEIPRGRMNIEFYFRRKNARTAKEADSGNSLRITLLACLAFDFTGFISIY
jgi:hypothetical protein